jgi:DinB superfamily
MATMEEYLTRPLADRLERLRSTPDALSAACRDRGDAELSRRPAVRSWSAKEIVCHLRDVEELFLTRFCTMLAMEEPLIVTLAAPPEMLATWGIGGPVGHPLDPDRWAEERQYVRSDAAEACAAFRRRRGELLALLEALSPAQWARGGVHVLRGRLGMGDWAASLAAHDDNHLGQLARALDGRP